MAKHLPWFNPLKGLLLAICVSILAALPAAAALSPAADSTQPSPDDIKVLQPSIIVPAGFWIHLSNLISSEIVEGIDVNSWKDYNVASSETKNVNINSDINYPCVWFWSSLTTTLTYTHKEFPDVTFSIEVTAKDSPASYLNSNLHSIYMDVPQSFTIPDDYMLLSDFTVEKVAPSSTYPNYPGEVNVEVDGNTVTVEGVKDGRAMLRLAYSKLNLSSSMSVEVSAKPTAESIKVMEESITVPTQFSVSLYDLINSSIIEGIAANSWQDFSVESSVTNNVSISNNGYLSFYSPITTTLTFTNKQFPEVKFSIEVTAKNSPVSYLYSNLRSVYMDVPKTFTLPDDYMPLSEFTVEKVAPSSNYSGELYVEADGNTITVEGVKEGRALLRLTYNKLNSSTNLPVEISDKPSTEAIKVLQPSIVVPTVTWVYLSTLIENGVVEGIKDKYTNDYTVKPSDKSFVGSYGAGFFSFSKPMTTTLTFTHKEFPEVSFSIEVTAKTNPAQVVGQNIKALYVGKSYTFINSDEYLPLDEFTIEKSGTSSADFSFEVNSKEFSIVAETEGTVNMTFKHKFGTTSVAGNVIKAPSVSDIRVKDDFYYFPWSTLSTFFRGFEKNLISSGDIVGVTTDEWVNYIPTCDNPKLVIEYDNIQGRYCVWPTEVGTYTVTYINKFFPDVKFDVTYIFKKCIDEFVMYNLPNDLPYHSKIVYVGQTISLKLTDEYIPLSAYDYIISLRQETDTILATDLDTENNIISFTGLTEGVASFKYRLPILRTKSTYVFGVNVVERPTVEEEPEVDENGEGEIISGLNQKVKVIVPKEIAEAAGDLPLIWKSSNEDIALIDENGIVNPSALGRTIITASIENTASRSAETVLMTIEFWVTELVADVPETLAVGSTAQASYMVDAGADEYTKSIKAEWESSNPAVVEIDSDGNITAMAEGQATITLTTDIGTKTAVVTVEAAGSEPETLSISPADVGLTVGNKLKLSAQGANGREVLWTTSNSFAVQVDGDGWLTAIAPGSATVTATIAGTTISSSVYVTVFERTTGIEETETSEPRIAVEGNTVTVEGIAADVTVEVYNMAGSRIASRKGSCVIAIDQSGIYLVRIGSMVRKVAVKR